MAKWVAKSPAQSKTTSSDWTLGLMSSFCFNLHNLHHGDLLLCAGIDCTRLYLFLVSSSLHCKPFIRGFFRCISVGKLCRGTRLRWAAPGCFHVGVGGAVLRRGRGKRRIARKVHTNTLTQKQIIKKTTKTSNTHRPRRGINTDSRQSRAASGALEREDGTQKDKEERRRKLHSSNVFPTAPPERDLYLQQHLTPHVPPP